MTEFAIDKPSQPCPSCGSSQSRPVFAKKFAERYFLLECITCSLAFICPRPTAQELEEVYSAQYHSQKRQGLGYDNYRDIGEYNMRKMWREFSTCVPLETLQPRSILDIGCATGAFLAEAAKDGYQCLGVEFSAEAAEIAGNEYGLNVLVGDLLELPVPTENFGLVTMWHILEHLPNPAASLKKAYESLAPGGYLFIEVPNWTSLGRFVRGDKWAPLKPPEHINFYSPWSIKTALEKLGFSVERTWTIYPHIADKVAEAGFKRPDYMVAGFAADLACRLGSGGLLRSLARKA